MRNNPPKNTLLKHTTKTVIVGLMAATAVIASSETAATAQRALLVGIGAYDHIRPLRGPARDIENVKAFLVEHWDFEADDIAVLTDAHATRERIVSAIETWLIDGTQPGDRAVFYYSGHGSQMPDSDGDEEDGLDETLSPVNTGKDGSNQITDDEFNALLSRMNGRDVTVIIDSCHSGTISRSTGTALSDSQYTDTARTFVPDLRKRSAMQPRYHVDARRGEVSFVDAGPSMRIWSAAASNQFSWDTLNGGIFTESFIRGAADRAADKNANGIVTNAELLAHVRARTAAYCETNPHCKPLGFTPILDADRKTLERAIVPVAAPPSDHVTDILVQDNDADVAIEILPIDTLRLGQVARFRVTSKKPGYLLLLDIDANNHVTQLIPNEIMDRNGQSRRIAPGRPITFPDAHYGFEFKASEPLGEGMLLAIVSQDKADIDSLLHANRAIEVVEKPREYLTELAERLMDVWKDDEHNRALRWSLVARKYSIVE